MNCSSAFCDTYIEYRPRRLFAEVHERNTNYARSTVLYLPIAAHPTSRTNPLTSPVELQQVLPPDSSSRSCASFSSPRRLAPISPHAPSQAPFELGHRAVGQLAGYLRGVRAALSSLASQHVFSRKLSYKSSGSSHSGGTSFPQLTVTCATAASPCHPSPRVYSKANDGE